MSNSPQMVALQICIQTYQPVFLWGEPGIGKTKTTEALAEALGARVWPVILAIREPSDQGGLPAIHFDEETKNTHVTMVPPRWARELIQEGSGVVNFDEMNASPPAVQNSALRVVNEGYAGDEKLPHETSFVSAGNPPATNPGVYDLTPAMANRHCHIEWVLSPAAFRAGLLNGWKLPPLVRLPEEWEACVPEFERLVASFIGRRPDLLNAKPEDPREGGLAWPSARSWTNATRLLGAAAACGYDVRSEVARILLAGMVGSSTQREFHTWVVNLDLRDPEEYMRDPHGTPLPKRQDQILATLDAVTGAALDETNHDRKSYVKRHEAAWVVIGRAARTKPDIAVPSARVLAPNMPVELDNKIPPDCDHLYEILARADIDFSAQG